MKPAHHTRQPGIGLNPDKNSSSALVWAPFAESIAIDVPGKGRYPLMHAGYGHWEGHELPLCVNDRYHIVIDDQKTLPDPASLCQPKGVHGPSQVVDVHAHPWNDGNWKGILADQPIIYELHTGTFSSSGDFNGIIEKLDYLSGMGINTIELMPVAQFPGDRNWGYDGVFPFAVQTSYGGLAGLQKLVDACHNKGLAVVLDVVYNHLGPEGNYLHEFGPYFTDKYKTPWGEAINFDDAWSDGVRNYFIENALMWLRDFHVDGLRLDAVHAIKDAGAWHFLAQLKMAVEEQSKKDGRHHFLIAECDLNDVRYINPPDRGGFNLDAQWCDEFHHSLHAYITRETKGYYADFGGIGTLVKTYNEAYVYDGIYSPHRKKIFGSKTTGQPRHKFVVFAQNHDQVGNRMLGRRISCLTNFEMQKLAAAFYLLSPFTPMLFMGEEYGELSPFLYFTSHSDPQLIQNIREGRKSEFKDFIKDREPADPQAEATFLKSKLTPQSKWDQRQMLMFKWYKKLISFRQSSPFWQNDARNRFSAEALSDRVMLVTAKYKGQSLKMLYNFGSDDFQYDENESPKIILCSARPETNGEIKDSEQFIKGNQVFVPGETMVVWG